MCTGIMYLKLSVTDSTNNEHSHEVKNLGKRFVNIFVYVADHVTSTESGRDAITLIVYLIVLIGFDTVELL